MKLVAIIISLVIIIYGQFAKYRYDTVNKESSKRTFLKSNFLWSALYEIGIIFLGAILAIQLTEFSEMKMERSRTISVLEQVSRLAVHDEMFGYVPIDIEKYSDEEYTYDIRMGISTSATNICNIAEDVITQSDVQRNISTISYIRFMGILSRGREYADSILDSERPSMIYKQIKDELDSLVSCISMEIEFQEGKRSEKKLGHWIGRIRQEPLQEIE